ADAGIRCLVLDRVEHLRLVDSWLRTALLPALPGTVTTIMVGRHRPTIPWSLAPGWQGLTAELPLGPLGRDDSRRLLHPLDVPDDAVDAITRFARGHPMALRLAAASPGALTGDEPATLPLVVERLVDRLLDGLPAGDVRVLQAAAMLRRVTEGDLDELLAGEDVEGDPGDWWTRLRDLPFVSVTAEGLELHDPVGDALRRSLTSRDPDRAARLRIRAVRTVRARVSR